ncbi:MAG: SDR family oxidoreductase [Alphaproteobacteria bacterium]|nr:SDR family oxidoreductase [Alphaproteobacteria bacterium]
MQNILDLTGRTAFVTGASGLLGAHFCRVLAGAGARVLMAARRVDAMADTAAAVGATTLALDVTDAASVRDAIAAAGPIDILVNNAGIAVTKPLLAQEAIDFDQVVDVNLRGCFLVATEVARGMVAGKRAGSIINIASILGERIIPGVAGYTAAKAGLLHLTRQMAVELARHNIRVNAIAPGYIASDINREFFASEPGLAMVKRIPQRRLGSPDDLTGALLLLASDASSHMTGSTITIDGGHSVASL